MAKIAKMAKFNEKMRFLMGETAKKVQKCVRGWLENAIVMSCARRVFQKVTAGVSLMKQSVRQNEMGMFWRDLSFCRCRQNDFQITLSFTLTLSLTFTLTIPL